jgi:hypothetical protein
MEPPAASRANLYRDIAIALRALAQTLKDAEARKELRVIAADYERLAKYAERRATPMARCSIGEKHRGLPAEAEPTPGAVWSTRHNNTLPQRIDCTLEAVRHLFQFEPSILPCAESKRLEQERCIGHARPTT